MGTMTGTRDDSAPASAEYRRMAFGVVLTAGFVHFLLGFVVQIACYEYRDWVLTERFALPGMTQWFVQCFCLPPSAYATYVVWSLWWSIFVVMIHCHFRTEDSADFSRRFLWGIVICGLLDLVALAYVATVMALPLIRLRASLEQPPSYMQTVPWIAMLMPVLVVVYFVVSAYRYRHSHPIVKRLPS